MPRLWSKNVKKVIYDLKLYNHYRNFEMTEEIILSNIGKTLGVSPTTAKKYFEYLNSSGHLLKKRNKKFVLTIPY